MFDLDALIKAAEEFEAARDTWEERRKTSASVPVSAFDAVGAARDKVRLALGATPDADSVTGLVKVFLKRETLTQAAIIDKDTRIEDLEIEVKTLRAHFIVLQRMMSGLPTITEPGYFDLWDRLNQLTSKWEDVENPFTEHANVIKELRRTVKEIALIMNDIATQIDGGWPDTAEYLRRTADRITEEAGP